MGYNCFCNRHLQICPFLLPRLDGQLIGKHPLMVRFMKGIKKFRPPKPRYTTTWDSDLVIDYLRDLSYIALKDLTLKLVMLLALVMALRAETLSKLKLTEMEDTGDQIVFRIGETLKTKAASTAVLTVRSYHPDSRLCGVILIR